MRKLGPKANPANLNLLPTAAIAAWAFYIGQDNNYAFITVTEVCRQQAILKASFLDLLSCHFGGDTPCNGNILTWSLHTKHILGCVYLCKWTSLICDTKVCYVHCCCCNCHGCHEVQATLVWCCCPALCLASLHMLWSGAPWWRPGTAASTSSMSINSSTGQEFTSSRVLRWV